VQNGPLPGAGRWEAEWFVVRSWPRQPTEWPKQHDHKNHCDHGQGEYNRHDGLLGHNSAHQYCGRFSSDGSLATLTAILFRCLGYRLRLNPVQSELRPHLCPFRERPASLRRYRPSPPIGGIHERKLDTRSSLALMQSPQVPHHFSPR
jgi:hypothetical protein